MKRILYFSALLIVFTLLVSCNWLPIPPGWIGAGDGHSLDAADGTPIDVVYVDNDGNVGIGTTSPQDKLEVSGDMMTLDSGPDGDITGIRIRENDEMRWTFLYKTWDAADKLYIRDEITGRDVMTFEPTTGNVGIGTTSPDDGKLEVNGAISTGHGGLR